MAELHQFLCMLSVAHARSSSGGIAISYVLPVLLMTSCFPIKGPIAQATTHRGRRGCDTVAWNWLTNEQ